MKILAHARAYTELLAALPSLGITLPEGQSLKDVLQTRLAAAPQAAAPDAAAVELAAVALLQTAGLVIEPGLTAAEALKAYAAEVEQSAANLQTAQASLGSIQSALAKQGIKLEADAKPEAVEAAIAARISTKAAEQLAATGTPPVPAAPSADPAAQRGEPKLEAGKELEFVAGRYAARLPRSRV